MIDFLINTMLVLMIIALTISIFVSVGLLTGYIDHKSGQIRWIQYDPCDVNRDGEVTVTDWVILKERLLEDMK